MTLLDQPDLRITGIVHAEGPFWAGEILICPRGRTDEYQLLYNNHTRPQSTHRGTITNVIAEQLLQIYRKQQGEDNNVKAD